MNRRKYGWCIWKFKDILIKDGGKEGSMYIRGKLYRGIVVALFIGLCTGVFGCGKEAASSVPLEQGEHIMYGSYQGEAIEWRVLDKKGDKVLLLSDVWNLVDWIYNLLIRVM